jgi:hypothetical protein
LGCLWLPKPRFRPELPHRAAGKAGAWKKVVPPINSSALVSLDFSEQPDSVGI